MICLKGQLISCLRADLHSFIYVFDLLLFQELESGVYIEYLHRRQPSTISNAASTRTPMLSIYPVIPMSIASLVYSKDISENCLIQSFQLKCTTVSQQHIVSIREDPLVPGERHFCQPPPLSLSHLATLLIVSWLNEKVEFWKRYKNNFVIFLMFLFCQLEEYQGTNVF